MIKSIKFTMVKASTYYTLGSVRFYDIVGAILPIEFNNKHENTTNQANFHIRNNLNNYGYVHTANTYNGSNYGSDNPFDTSRISESWSDRFNYWLSGNTDNISIFFNKPIALSKVTFKPYSGDGISRKQNSVTLNITLHNGNVLTKTYDTSACLENETYTVDILAIFDEFNEAYDELFLMKNISTNKYYSTDTLKQEYVLRMINATTEASGQPIVISASTNYDGSHREFRAFMRDMPSSNGWVSKNGGGIAGQWLQIDYGRRRYVNWARISTRNYQQPTETLKDFDIMGSYDGVNFKVVAEIRNTPAWQKAETREFKFQHPKDYRYYRIYVHANHGLPNYVTIGDVVFGYTSIVELDELSEDNFRKYSYPSIEDFTLPLGNIIKPIHKEKLANNALVTVQLGERPKSIKLIKR